MLQHETQRVRAIAVCDKSMERTMNKNVFTGHCENLLSYKQVAEPQPSHSQATLCRINKTHISQKMFHRFAHVLLHTCHCVCMCVCARVHTEVIKSEAGLDILSPAQYQRQNCICHSIMETILMY